MKTTLTFFLILLCTATLPTISSAQVRWLPDETVRTQAGTGMEVKMGFNNAHAVASIGTRRFITWMRSDSLFVSSSEGGLIGSPWSAPRLVFRGASVMNLPTIAATSSGQLCIGWNDPQGVKTIVSGDGGNSWGTVQNLASKGGGLCLAAGANGILYALWHSGNEDASDVMFATWQNGSWSQARAIDAAPADKSAIWSSLCVVGNRLYAVWRENSIGTNFRVFMARSENGGTTWDTPRNIIAEDRSGDPTVAADSKGNVVVAYQRNSQVYVTNSGDGGATFSTPKNVGGGLFARVIGNESGFFALAWERFSGNNAQNDAAKQTGFVYSTDYGWTFSKDSALSAQGSKLGLVQFTGTNELTASWFNVNNGGTIVAKRAAITTAVSVRTNEVIPFAIAPNPAQNIVTVKFTLTKSERISLKLFNALGQEIAQILDGNLPVGNYEKSLDISRWSSVSGAYFLQLQTSYQKLQTIPFQVIR